MDYFELAEKIARGSFVNAREKHFLFGCVARRNDGALVVSSNIRTSTQHLSAHAETRVLRKAGTGAILWLVRINRSHNWSMAKPCKGCEVYLANKGAKRVYYSIAPNEYGVMDF